MWRSLGCRKIRRARVRWIPRGTRRREGRAVGCAPRVGGALQGVLLIDGLHLSRLPRIGSPAERCLGHSQAPCRRTHTQRRSIQDHKGLGTLSQLGQQWRSFVLASELPRGWAGHLGCPSAWLQPDFSLSTPSPLTSLSQVWIPRALLNNYPAS